MIGRSLAVGVAALGVLGLLSGCNGSGEPTAAERASADGRPAGEITVLAAASLTEAFTAIGDRFEARYPGTTVRFSFGPSNSLAEQALAGAPADVLATASTATIQTVVEEGRAASPPGVFARNRLQIAVPTGNPGEVTGLDDFARDDLVIALCATSAPCGSAARSVLDAAGVDARPDTLEPDVKAVLTKVRLGEVDAALVYRTDIRAAGDEVEGIEVPGAVDAVNDYPLVVLTDAPNPLTAAAFAVFASSADAREVLADAGFELP